MDIIDYREDLHLSVKVTGDQPDVAGVCGELAEGRVESDPLSCEDLRPGMVIKETVLIGQTCSNLCRYSC